MWDGPGTPRHFWKVKETSALFWESKIGSIVAEEIFGGNANQKGHDTKENSPGSLEAFPRMI